MIEASGIYYGGRLFRAVKTQGTSEVGSDTVFKYEQKIDLLTGSYAGGDIRYGQIIGIAYADGTLEFCYQHMNMDGALMTGTCQSTPEIMENGKIRLHEVWKWTCGDRSSGTSTLEEL